MRLGFSLADSDEEEQVHLSSKFKGTLEALVKKTSLDLFLLQTEAKHSVHEGSQYGLTEDLIVQVENSKQV